MNTHIFLVYISEKGNYDQIYKIQICIFKGIIFIWGMDAFKKNHRLSMTKGYKVRC